MTKAIMSSQGTASSSSKKAPLMSPRVCERLRRQQSEPTCNDAMQAGSVGFCNTSRWKDSSSSKRTMKASTCLRKSGSRDLEGPKTDWARSAYMDMGQVNLVGHDYTFSEYGKPEKYRFHSSLNGGGRVNLPLKEEQIDEHMREMPGKQSWPPMQQKKYYQNAFAETEHPIEKPLSKTALMEWGRPAKHHHMSNQKIYPEKPHEQEQPERPPAWRPPEWGTMDKHHFHMPPFHAPKCDKGLSRIHHIPGKSSEIPLGGAPAATKILTASRSCGVF